MRRKSFWATDWATFLQKTHINDLTTPLPVGRGLCGFYKLTILFPTQNQRACQLRRSKQFRPDHIHIIRRINSYPIAYRLSRQVDNDFTEV